MLATALVYCLLWQDPEPPQPARPSEAEPAEAAVVELTDAEARAAVADFREAVRGRDVSMADRMRAVEALAGRAHEKLVPPLAEFVLKDESVVLRKRAVELLAVQPDKQAGRALHKLMRVESLKDDPPVHAALIRAWSAAGYEPRHWDEIDDEFGRDYAAERVPVQEAILHLVTAHKEKQAVDMLLENLDEPIPVDVDSPTNPPAEYWEKRWKAWKVWREQVKEALFAITGQRFSTSAEARAWIRKNGLK